MRSQVWDGLKSEDMAEVNALIEPSLGRSTRQPDKERRKPDIQPVSTSKHVGKVAYYNAEKRFGFIGSDRLFFHASDIVDGNASFIRQGSAVAYEEGTDSRRGTAKAIDVQLVHE